MRRRGLLDDGYDEETYLNTLEAEAKNWAERHFAHDAAQVARDARRRAVEMQARRERQHEAGTASARSRAHRLNEPR
jgi:hypothetical protein